MIEREIYVRWCEMNIRRISPWWFRPVMRWIAGYERREITDGRIWRRMGRETVAPARDAHLDPRPGRDY